ncbi:outer membrane protein assembly factor [Desulfurispira natronophila]|uniref:Outer membrane protein assembly factor BamA n=1 Tax=Desulfurispira natronophila TaxID=682562 RepID=A0A7W7Y5J1_9BACT|nr:outer membrane protein assembly factor [Desulfurispira natronophila]MBB5022299.1 outer membrane protein assembly factor BamA [Desulfurispira natronophila]
MIGEILTIAIIGVSDGDRELLERLFPTPMDRQTVESVVEQVDGLRFFRVKEAELEGQHLQLNISRSYPVEDIVLRGNWAFLDSTIFQELSAFPVYDTDTRTIARLEQQVRTFYHLSGYLDVEVNVVPRRQGYTSILQVNIRENSPYVVTDLTYLGHTDIANPPTIIPGTFFEPYRIIRSLERWKLRAIEKGYVNADYFFSYEQNERTFPGFAITAPFKTLLNFFNPRRGISVYYGLYPGEQLDITIEAPDAVDRKGLLDSIRLDQRTAIDDFEIPIIASDTRRYLRRQGFRVEDVYVSGNQDEIFIGIEAHRIHYEEVGIESPYWGKAMEQQLPLYRADEGFDHSGLNRLQGDIRREAANRAVDARTSLREDTPKSATVTVDMRFPRLPLVLSVSDGLDGNNSLQEQAVDSLYELYHHNERSIDDSRYLAQHIQRLYAEKGYLKARAQVQRSVLDRHVAVEVLVDPGPRYRNASVLTFGAESTSRRYVRRVMRYSQMDEYASLSAIEQAQQNIESERIFSYSNYQGIKVGERYYHVVQAEDRGNIFGAVALGYDSFYGPNVQFRVGHGNVMGRGGELTATQRQSARRSISALEYHEDFSFGIPIDTTYTLSRTRAERQSYTSHVDLFSMTIRHFLHESIPLSFSYSHSEYGYRSVSSGLDRGEDYDDGAYHHVGVNVRYNRTDSLVAPTKGFDLQSSYLRSLSQSQRHSDFQTLTLKGSYYLPPWRRGVIALHGEAGQISRDDRLPIPLESRFSLGGANSVRGFEHERVALRSAGGARIGGLAYDRVTAEYRHAFGNIETVLYYDMGNVYPEQLWQDGPSDPYTGVGTGLRYRTPVGPIRLDVAKATTHKTEADSYEIYLTIGYSF